MTVLVLSGVTAAPGACEVMARHVAVSTLDLVASPMALLARQETLDAWLEIWTDYWAVPGQNQTLGSL